MVITQTRIFECNVAGLGTVRLLDPPHLSIAHSITALSFLTSTTPLKKLPNKAGQTVKSITSEQNSDATHDEGPNKTQKGTATWTPQISHQPHVDTRYTTPADTPPPYLPPGLSGCPCQAARERARVRCTQRWSSA